MGRRSQDMISNQEKRIKRLKDNRRKMNTLPFEIKDFYKKQRSSHKKIKGQKLLLLSLGNKASFSLKLNWCTLGE